MTQTVDYSADVFLFHLEFAIATEQSHAIFENLVIRKKYVHFKYLDVTNFA